MKIDFKAAWRDWTIFGLRWVFLVFITVILFIHIQHQNPILQPADVFNLLLIPLVVGGVANLLFGLVILISALEGLRPFIMMIGDWAIIGAFTYVTEGEPTLMVGIAGAIMLPGLLRLGMLLGSVHVLGAFVAMVAGLIVHVGMDNVNQVLPEYIVPFLVVVLLVITVGTWVYMREGHTEGEARKRQREMDAQMERIHEMQTRTRALSDMAKTLSSTLNFEQVLEAALNIGQELRTRKNQRMIGIVMLFDYTGKSLLVETSRGLQLVDDHRTIPGAQGVVGKALKEAIPVVGTDPTKDPELKNFSSMVGLQSLLCIPLRANFESFGVLIYGTDLRDAFSHESLDTWEAIGTQATIAMHNAQLYSNLMDEKERIIKLEEDGRKSLARDLHDSPAQTIAAVKMRIEIAQRLLERKPESVYGDLEEIKELAGRANDEIRHVLSSLYPLALETQGLIGALKQSASDMQSKFNQQVRMQLSPVMELNFTKHQQGVLYSLITEAIGNASEHAEAKMVKVHTVQQGNDLVIQIVDDGKGFDVEAAMQNDRFGLKNLYRRAESLNGVCEIQSVVGRGTKVMAVIPIREKTQPHAPTRSGGMHPSRR